MRPDLQSANAVARLVRCGDGAFALPVHTTLEIVEHPQAVPVPGAARHALGLLEWQDKRIALIDAAVLLAGAQPRTSAPRYALIVAMQASAGAALDHGAIALDELPESIAVGDEASCALPGDPRWQAAAISCFQWNGHPVPIVDTARLFGA